MRGGPLLASSAQKSAARRGAAPSHQLTRQVSWQATLRPPRRAPMLQAVYWRVPRVLSPPEGGPPALSSVLGAAAVPSSPPSAQHSTCYVDSSSWRTSNGMRKRA